VHHKKGQPCAATSHESRPGKPSFCIFGLRTRHTRSVVEQITRNTELGKPLGLYPNTSTRCYTTTWRSNEPASSRPRRQRRHNKFYTTSPCPYHSLHDTIPSGKDTYRPARSSDLSMVRRNNSYNHQRCRRRRGQARAIQTRPNSQRETRSS